MALGLYIQCRYFLLMTSLNYDNLNLQDLIVKVLLNPEVYDVKVNRVKLIQTYHSFVFLAGNFAYKIKKAVKFPYFDFSTLEKRKEDLEKELKLNKRLAPNLYIGIVPITMDNGVIKVDGRGRIVEYALKMKRIPERYLMSKLLEENRISGRDVENIAKIIANFHFKAESSNEINRYGSIEILRFNWNENFEQTREFINITISENQFNFIKDVIDDFIHRSMDLFEKRIKYGRIRDCHGDLHSESIFITPNEIYIFDCLEFIDRFRFSDVASEVAFLAMDLDFHDRSDLSDIFVNKYVEISGDRELLKLLPFYKCYRAYVRGKVESFKLKDPNIRNREKKIAIKKARKYFNLAFNYAKQF
ncbi:MAG: hypothetical protein N3E39_01475 [Candidatus Methanomethylicia archaeon]|nr:hypothetical protein [Candidatus Methanomethylicia archaeon]